MAVPDFQTLMRPLLEEYATGGEKRIADVRALLARRFGLTEEELAARLPSGLARTFDNRVGWAATYLYRVALLARPRRSVYAITARGRQVLAANPERVDLGVLSQFPEFAEFRKASATRRTRAGAGLAIPLELVATETATPEERIDVAYQELRQALIAEVRDRIAAVSSTAFEDLVLDVLHAMGYGDGTEHSRLRTGASGDAGIDGVIRPGLAVPTASRAVWSSVWSGSALLVRRRTSSACAEIRSRRWGPVHPCTAGGRTKTPYVNPLVEAVDVGDLSPRRSERTVSLGRNSVRLRRARRRGAGGLNIVHLEGWAGR